MAALTSLPARGRSLLELPRAVGRQQVVPPAVLQVPYSSYGPSLPLCSKRCGCLRGQAGMARGWLRAKNAKAEPQVLVTFPHCSELCSPLPAWLPLASRPAGQRTFAQQAGISP